MTSLPYAIQTLQQQNNSVSYCGKQLTLGDFTGVYGKLGIYIHSNAWIKKWISGCENMYPLWKKTTLKHIIIF